MKKCDKIFTGLICLFFLGMSLLYAVLPSSSGARTFGWWTASWYAARFRQMMMP